MKLSKRIVLIILALVVASNTSNSQVENLWGIQSGSAGEEYVLNHLVDSDGNIYITGKTTGALEGNNAGLNDGFIISTDNSGKGRWSRQFGSDGDEDVLWSAIDNSGNIYITGSTTGALAGKNPGKEDFILVKYSSAGVLNWKKQIGTDSTDIARGICTDSKGFIYVAGVTTGKLGEKASGKGDCIIIKLDSEGNIIRTHQFGTPLDDQLQAIAGSPEGNIFVCGTTWGEIAGGNKGMVDGFMGKFTADLNQIALNQFGSEGFDIPLVLHAAKDGIYVAGSTSGNFAANQIGEGDCFLLKIDGKGEIVWNNQFGTDHHDGVRGIDIDPRNEGNILLSGILNLPPERAFVRMYKKDGSMLWEKIFEADAQKGGASGKDVNFDSKGNITHLGLTGFSLFGPVIGGHDFYLVKMKVK